MSTEHSDSDVCCGVWNSQRKSLDKSDQDPTSRLSNMGFGRTDNLNILTERGVCWFHTPDENWSISYYFSTRGQDSLHIYLWLLKDLSWVQAWYVSGHVFGALTITWAIYMIIKAIRSRSAEEIFVSVSQFLWLFGNFWWMLGELHDSKFPNEAPWYDQYAYEAGCVVSAALAVISLYYFILKPLGIFPVDAITDAEYDSPNLVCRFPGLFKSWREYENIHILFWAGKDLAWNLEILVMWCVFAVPTFFIALDFVFVSLWVKRGLIDHSHYCAQFLWVIANAVWAFGEFILTPDHDEPIEIEKFNREARLTSRWYSSWAVTFAFVPLVVLYFVWIPATLMGWIETPADVCRLSMTVSGLPMCKKDEVGVSEVELRSTQPPATSNPMIDNFHSSGELSSNASRVDRAETGT
mmetsp:Transcript_10844/g.16510  ORF Transcript_10844/g.16510 Transcript_10844/m.16510 type:complete len:410 (+) Transcript_10844:194-1423(+)|eukprot:CAMPEP_0185028480 /NCGR_PEP_ID=MMETSP1103-20130426/14223_1 /TAXON_ID=36769 /ORGANISM="Paraphysomonas bandaiensis, Strain Caron Lab Isolate" /LENGTH=409 /DNA_ID=CAMNT_0027562907 /DNA_START=150 /DNA_END=1379 /DNA_ORIENTATION=+